MIFQVWVISRIYKSYEEHSYIDILNDIFGKYMGTVISFAYLAWIIQKFSINIRFFGERLVTIVFPNTNVSALIIIMLILLTYVFHSGIETAARMGEVIFPLILITYFLTVILSIPNIKVSNLTPVSYNHVLPVITTSLKGTVSINSFFMLAFFFSDRIKDKENTFKYGIYTALFVVFANITLIAICIGVMGSSIVSKLPYPFLVVVRNISVLGILQRFESVTMAIWVLSDFIALYINGYIALHFIKDIFNLRQESSVSIPYVSFSYVLALYFAGNQFELEKYGSTVLVVIEIIFLFAIPVILLIVGRIRGKIGKADVKEKKGGAF